jgi:hypothetical protein
MTNSNVSILLKCATEISAQLPCREPKTPPELHDAQYARAGQCFAKHEAQIFAALNELLASSSL